MTEPVDNQPPIADLNKVSVRNMAQHEGDPTLEATLKRLKHEVEQPREAVSGFSSAI